MQSIKGAFTTDFVISDDHSKIAYRKYGFGKGLILVNGAGRKAEDFNTLAQILATHFTVYTYDRRGRGLSNKIKENHSIEKECEDLTALIKATKASFVFGHSYGGLITFETALRCQDIQKMAVYDPGIFIGQNVPTHWLSAFKKALQQQQYEEAIAFTIKALELNGMHQLPTQWLIYILKFLSFFQNEEKKAEKKKVLPTIAIDIDEMLQLDPNVNRYQEIAVPVLLLKGQKSPSYLQEVLPKLQSALPYSETYSYKHYGHAAPEIKSKAIAKELISFFR